MQCDAAAPRAIGQSPRRSLTEAPARCSTQTYTRHLLGSTTQVVDNLKQGSRPPNQSPSTDTIPRPSPVQPRGEKRQRRSSNFWKRPVHVMQGNTLSLRCSSSGTREMAFRIKATGGRWGSTCVSMLLLGQRDPWEYLLFKTNAVSHLFQMRPAQRLSMRPLGGQ